MRKFSLEELRSPIPESKPTLIIWELLSQRSFAADEIERLQEALEDCQAANKVLQEARYQAVTEMIVKADAKA